MCTLCFQDFGVKGYPTIKVFGANKGEPTDYNGARDSGSLAAFAIEQWSSMQPPPEVCLCCFYHRDPDHSVEPDSVVIAVRCVPTLE